MLSTESYFSKFDPVLVSFMVGNYQDRVCRLVQHAARHAAVEPSSHARPSMCRHDNEVYVQPDRGVEHTFGGFAQPVFALRRIFGHQRQIRSDERSFFITDIGWVGFSVHPHSSAALLKSA